MRAAAIEILVTTFKGLQDTAGDTVRCLWQRIVDVLTEHKIGTREGTLFCGASFKGKRRRENVVARHLYIQDVEANKATGEIPPDVATVRKAIEARHWAAVIYTTFNHTAASPRYRVVLLPGAPIVFDGNAKAIEADGDVTLGLADMLGLGGVIDRTKLCAESMFFLPRHADGSEYEATYIDGDPLDGDDLLEARGLGRQLREDEDAYVAAAAEAPKNQDGVIGQYNASVSVSELLARYGYKRKPRSLVDWRSPYQQSESYATRVYDDSRFVTLSASDIAAGIGRQTRGGAAACGDAFDLFTAYEHKGDGKAAFRAAIKLLGLDAKKPGDEWSDASAGAEDFGATGPDSDTESETGGEKPVHPLARFVTPLPDKLVQPKMILPGLIASGLVVIAGQHGVGKTTVLASIVVKVAGATVEGDPLAPRYGRHVVYVSEDTDQFQRIMYAVSKAIPGAADTIRRRVHLVEAVRLPVDKVVEVASFYAEHFTEEVDGARLPPLVVLDTRSAIIAVDDENDNAETSRIMAALKQRFAGLPTWIVGHVAKASFGRADAKNMSARGATALEGDAHQVVFIVIEDDDQRFLIRGKTRFEASVASCRLISHVDTEFGVDEFGAPCEIPVRHVTIEPLTAEEEGDRRAEVAAARKQAAEEGKEARWEADKQRVLDLIIAAGEQGERLGKSDVYLRAKPLKRSRAAAVLAELLDEERLVVRPWRKEDRRGNQAEGWLQPMGAGDWVRHKATGDYPETVSGAGE